MKPLSKSAVRGKTPATLSLHKHHGVTVDAINVHSQPHDDGREQDDARARDTTEVASTLDNLLP